ncbi:MAG: hypothetical protein LUH56_07830 [Oscillospiraceae bacterium]|nr:hypothetical protein [Oscillospiraceae bacterium]
MKMRKLMAVLLAVVVAISAMAISVFADETYTIPMYNYSSTTTSTSTYTISVPLYGLYGYLVAGDTITLNLPTTFVSDDDGDGAPDYELPVSYTLTVGGVEVKLQGSADAGADSTTYGTYSQDVTVGYAAQDYTLVSWANFEAFAMVPQSTSVSASTTMTITATVDWSGYSSDPTCESWEAMATWWPVWGMYYGQQVIATVESATQGTTEIYGYSLSVSKSNGSSKATNSVVIIADTTTDDDTFDEEDTANTLLYWDHTLYNRNIMLVAASTEGATATLEVNLADSITGYAVYTLTTTAEAASSSDVYSYSTGLGNDLWYTSGTSALYNAIADTYALAGETTSTLTFDVPVSALYNSTYGLYNGTMFITQLVTATSNSDYLSLNYYTNSYDADGDGTTDTYTLEATEVNLIVTIPTDDDDTVVENDDPIEDTNTETENDELEVDDTDDTTTEPETNPTTGIVLALVPMAVAAAAAVASKRR